VSDIPQPGEPGAGEPENPLGGGGFDLSQLSQLDLAQMMRMLQSEGPVNWEVARQIAGFVALGGEDDEPAVDPADHEQLDELVRAAQTHVVSETGLAATFGAPLRTLGPKGWAELHLRALEPVLEALATTLERTITEATQSPGEYGGPPEVPPESEGEGTALGPFGLPMGEEAFAGLMGMMAPLLLGVQAGSMVGYLAQHALGRYDLPLPTSDPPSLCFVVTNLDRFEKEWSLDRADLRFAVALHEVVRAAERSVPWVQERLVRLAVEYVSAYEVDPSAFEEQLGNFDPADPASLSGMAEHPEALLGAMQSPRQRDVLDRLQTYTSVLEGYADDVVERIGSRLVPSFARIHEATQRHRVERGEAERFIEGLLGLKLDRDHDEQGRAFCRGVVERVGVEGLNRLWEREAMLPTAPELVAPGLWLARIDLPE
jgi:putative hydrolase